MLLIDYNTQRKNITLKEYGRNIESMVKNLMEVEDKESRNAQAKNLVEVMKQFIQPGNKDNVDLTHKVWDDLFIISNFTLDIECPFPIPSIELITRKPDPILYTYSNPIYRHYGKNIELLIKNAIEIENPEEKDNAIIYIARLMKSFYAQYNKDVVDDQVIKDQLEKLSKGKISLDLERTKRENLLDVAVREKKVIPNTVNGNTNAGNNIHASGERRNTDRMGKNMKNLKKRRK